MAIKNARFITSIASPGEYIETESPQIAFVGKSNVGKSSLINTLCNNKKLARTSQTPGKTRLINYFSINNDAAYFVDLPGYGFARAPKTEQEKWGELIEGYLSSGLVTHLFLLLDSRHPPTANDKQIFYWVQYHTIPYTFVATKMDKIAKSRRGKALQDIKKEMNAVSAPIGVSSADRIGMNELTEKIDQIVMDFEMRKAERDELIELID